MNFDQFDIRKYVNFWLVLAVGALLFYGAVMVYSATSSMIGGRGMVIKQIFGMCVGGVFLIGFWIFDYKHFEHLVLPLWILDIFLIVSPRVLGIVGLARTAKGMEGWLAIGGVNILQPAEPAKLVTIILLAAVVAQYQGDISTPKDFWKTLSICLVPAMLIMLIPDLGTALVFVAISLGILWVGGSRFKYLVPVIVIGLALAIGLVFVEANHAKTDPDGDGYVLKQYQLSRLIVFVDPEYDSKGAGYNLKQSLIAIGSGQMDGMGLKSGTQSNLNFLPERHTDFIFSVLGEEMGFVGALTLLGLYLALLMVALNICASSSDIFGSLICAGIISMWTFQILQNAGMAIGLMPITGIPLPFMSYGSSFMVTNLACVGVLLSVWVRRNYQSPIKGVSNAESTD